MPRQAGPWQPGRDGLPESLRHRRPAPLAPWLVGVWYVDLDAWAGTGTTWLSPPERERAARLRPAGDRGRWVASRQALRFLLARLTGSASAAVPLVPGPRGRLAAVDGWHLSVSHSDRLGLLAVARQPLGVDIQVSPALPPGPALLARVCSPRERAELAGLPSSELDAAFLRAWVRKEALLKARGTGLLTAPAGVDVGVLARGRPRAGGVRWSLRDLEAPTGFAAALAVPRLLPRVLVRELLPP